MFNKSCVLISYNDSSEFNRPAKGDYIIVFKNAISRDEILSCIAFCNGSVTRPAKRSQKKLSSDAAALRRCIERRSRSNEIIKVQRLLSARIADYNLKDELNSKIRSASFLGSR